MKRSLIAVALLACLGTATADAQERQRAAYEEPTLTPRDPSLQLAAPDPELYRAERRQRLWLAAGVGLLASSLAHLGVLAVDSCNNNSHASVGAAGIIGGAGLAFSLGGGIRLARSHPRYPASRGQRLGAFFTALGAAAAAQALLMGLWTLQGQGACAS